ncbi:putative zinc-binding metallopeptidase [Frankia sp. CNm7]|uniref:Zinc-binding metallopeptidase n=1 Tax=Frankia nepalensis TaxID=1836974 RepID=A0A937RR18_9ACTN|nr:putative zinc-binding metallopeptidase [Frankia nepalensis]MBL7497403.1 putative zinc-binding metallopeptidase [Frankia nepalensis]MBL7512106.1 putative zinc-binding metallopeptidase [Frankia nepalensis]MBL7519389.1 putative zinc-binding metallopeptidase [Frankia nepalensis]MBL7631794.1 putative zinc-binding metallopeptidase [Frankia nepalensis]
MRDFACPRCGQRLTFENSRCLGCHSSIGFDPDARSFAVLTAEGIRAAGAETSRCANLDVAACNWLAPAGSPSGLCGSCALTRTRPADTDLDALPAFAEAEAAKRRLVFELIELGLPVRGRDVNPATGLCFDLLSSSQERVVTGHADGVITLDLAEGDDVHREQLRVSMAEPYRTLLGHFRHEIGHYYFTVLTESGDARARFHTLFGDPDADYQAALDRHYQEGPPRGWQETYVSAYATMHPAEDWAETFAHYLHIRDTLDTAAAFGFAPAGATLATPLAGEAGFRRIVELWLPLAWSLNMINRSMGHPDLYPFVLPPPALDKMRLVHQLVAGHGDTGQGDTAPAIG